MSLNWESFGVSRLSERDLQLWVKDLLPIGWFLLDSQKQDNMQFSELTGLYQKNTWFHHDHLLWMKINLRILKTTNWSNRDRACYISHHSVTVFNSLKEQGIRTILKSTVKFTKLKKKGGESSLFWETYVYLSQVSLYSDKIRPGMKHSLQKLNLGNTESILEKC